MTSQILSPVSANRLNRASRKSIFCFRHFLWSFGLEFDEGMAFIIVHGKELGGFDATRITSDALVVDIVAAVYVLFEFMLFVCHEETP